MKKIIIMLILAIIILASACKKEIENQVQCVKVPEVIPYEPTDVGQVPKGTWEEKKCESGKKVVYIDLIKTEDNSRWRKALYCEDENYFWIADMDSTRLTEIIIWYGTFEGKPCSNY